LGQTRVIGGGRQFQLVSGGPTYLLLGLIHGHYEPDSQEALLVQDVKEETIRASINAGIAIVVPFAHIREVVEYAMSGTVNGRSGNNGQ
jgi:hypothetical protein